MTKLDLIVKALEPTKSLLQIIEERGDQAIYSSEAVNLYVCLKKIQEIVEGYENDTHV